VVSIKTSFTFGGRYRYPELILCNPNKSMLGYLTNIKNLKFTLRSMDVSEMTFDVYRTDGTAEFDDYRYVRKMRLIHVEEMGYFVI